MKEDKVNNQDMMQDDEELKDFPIDIKRDIIDIINDTPSLVMLDNKEYRVKNLRYYSLNRICRIVLDMRKADETLDNDNAVITALCTDLNAMCEIIAIVICNHLFKPEDINSFEDVDSVLSRNDKWIEIMKAKVMYSTYDPNQWAAIILGAIKSVDLTAFFLLRKLVNTHTDSLLARKRKSTETVSRFLEAQSLQTQQTS